jgi:hypothetical protein
MKVLISMFNADDNRYGIQGSSIISHLKSLPHIIKKARVRVKSNAIFYAINCPKFKLEFFTDNNFYGEPYKTLEVTI